MASPSSQVVPVQPAVQVHVLGAVHTPSFWQGEEQMAAEDTGKIATNCLVNKRKDDSLTLGAVVTCPSTVTCAVVKRGTASILTGW